MGKKSKRRKRKYSSEAETHTSDFEPDGVVLRNKHKHKKRRRLESPERRSREGDSSLDYCERERDCRLVNKQTKASDGISEAHDTADFVSESDVAASEFGEDGGEVLQAETSQQQNVDPKIEEYLKSLPKVELDAEKIEKLMEGLVFSDEELMMINNLDIMIDWKLPPAHDTAGIFGKRIVQNKMAELEEMRIETRWGPFTPAEDKILLENWENFKKMTRITDPALCRHLHKLNGTYKKYRDQRDRRLKFYQFLARGLPNRLLLPIYFRFWRLMRPIYRGKFTPVEDATVLQFVKEFGKDFQVLGKYLNREKDSVMARWTKLCEKRGLFSSTVKFTSEESAQLIKAVLDKTGCQKIEDVDEGTVPWNEIGDDLQHPASSVQQHWKVVLKSRLVIDKPVDLREMRIKMVRRLYESGIKYSQDIKWTEIAKEFPGFTPWCCNMKFYYLVNRNVPDWQNMKFEDILRHLYIHWLPKAEGLRKKPPTVRIIPLVLNEKGKLVPKGCSRQEEEEEQW